MTSPEQQRPDISGPFNHVIVSRADSLDLPKEVVTAEVKITTEKASDGSTSSRSRESSSSSSNGDSNNNRSGLGSNRLEENVCSKRSSMISDATSPSSKSDTDPNATGKSKTKPLNFRNP